MNSETIVAVYKTPKDADAAIHDLKVHHVPPAAITLHSRDEEAPEASPGVKAPPEQHFLPRMFGYEPTPQAERDELIYERSLKSGASIVVVHGPLPDVDVAAILEKHHPVDIGEAGAAVNRVQRYGGAAATE